MYVLSTPNLVAPQALSFLFYCNPKDKINNNDNNTLQVNKLHSYSSFIWAWQIAN